MKLTIFSTTILLVIMAAFELITSAPASGSNNQDTDNASGRSINFPYSGITNEQGNRGDTIINDGDMMINKRYNSSLNTNPALVPPYGPYPVPGPIYEAAPVIAPAPVYAPGPVYGPAYAPAYGPAYGPGPSVYAPAPVYGGQSIYGPVVNSRSDAFDLDD